MRKNEKVFYYASSINKNGKVIYHDGNPKYAIYKSDIELSQKRANLWHKWVENNFKGKYDGLGVINQDFMAQNKHICDAFMDGTRTS